SLDLFPILFADDVAVMSRRHVADASGLIDQFETIGTDVDVAAFRIARYRRSRAHVRTAVLLVPTHPGKNLEVDVFVLLDVLFDRRVIDINRRQGLKLFHLAVPPTRRLSFAELRRAAMDDLLPLRV